MKAYLSVIAMLFLSPLLGTAQTNYVKFASNDYWTLVLEKHDVQIYTRWIPNEEGTQTREIKGVFQLDAQPEKILNLLREERSPSLFMDKAIDGYNFNGSEDGTFWNMYVEFNFPWPLKNQDVITENKLIRNDDGSIVVPFRSNHVLVPEKKGVKRLTSFMGKWQFTRQDESLLVEYFMYTKEEPKYPRWITDPIVQKNLLKTMVNVRELASVRT